MLRVGRLCPIPCAQPSYEMALAWILYRLVTSIPHKKTCFQEKKKREREKERENCCKQQKTCLKTFATPWTAASQAPPFMGFSRQEYWSGLPFPSPGDLPDPGIEPGSPTLQADALPSKPPGKPRLKTNAL